jgi:hypothetical protein
MPTKTDRILSNLPSTFGPLPRPTALYSVADAFGGELQRAENVLATVMFAHWVDYADRNQEFISDLACFAQLYGLRPRGAPTNGQSAMAIMCPNVPSDETVEEFRERLKRYVKMFLDGTTNVQGVFRVVANALGMHIADSYLEMDVWWRRAQDSSISTEIRGDDAARLLFGVRSAVAAGHGPLSARAVGKVSLRNGVDLRGASILRIAVDSAASAKLDFTNKVPDLSRATVDQIAQAINGAVGRTATASTDGKYLLLESRTAGLNSRLELLDGDNDAAPKLLGLLPTIYEGSAATAATLTGSVDLRGVLDLTSARFLRLLIDGARLAEVDCGGANPRAQTVAGIVSQINEAFGARVASTDGQFLTLRSPTIGFTSTLACLTPTSQDATQRLLGVSNAFCNGSGDLAARVTGTRDLSAGVDLSVRSKITLQFDTSAPLTITCSGRNPARTQIAEIVQAMNAAAGAKVADYNGPFVTLSSVAKGAGARIQFIPTAPADATDAIFGIAPRVFRGESANSARLAGTPDLSGGLDLRAQNVVAIAVDNNPARLISLISGIAGSAKSVTLTNLCEALNAELGPGIATTDGKHLILTSPTSGEASRVSFLPSRETKRRRFVARAFITDEAAPKIFGFLQQRATGAPAAPARVVGKIDLSRGVDVRVNRYLRLSIDAAAARDLDVSMGVPRPRVALPDDLVAAINRQIPGLASHDGKHLILTSPNTGSGSEIVFEPAVVDASEMLGLTTGIYKGRDAAQVVLRSTVDLSAGLDLSQADQIQLSIDGAPPKQFSCAGPDRAHSTAIQIAAQINSNLGAAVASTDGAYITIRSSKTGPSSKIEFAVPSRADATRIIFGFAAPRQYSADAPQAAELLGTKDLATPSDLRLARYLQLKNGAKAAKVDCTLRAQNPSRASLDEIIESIIGAFPGVAARNGNRLVLRSTETGASARLELALNTAGDAKAVLFGAVPGSTRGADASPAVMVGEIKLHAPVNLAERSLLRLSIDGAEPSDVDVAGASPEQTSLNEIIDRLNSVFPGMASATSDERLSLTAPSAGNSSSLDLEPLRALEMIEYPPVLHDEPSAEKPPYAVHAGENFILSNDGAADTALGVEITAPQGESGMGLANLTAGLRVRVEDSLQAGETLSLWLDDNSGLTGSIASPSGEVRLIPSSRIIVDRIATTSSGGAVDDRTAVLTLPRNQSKWVYTNCHESRFNAAEFDNAYFSGGPCRTVGIFDVSHFVDVPPKDLITIFGPVSDPHAQLRFHWRNYQPGAFVMNLPADLPEEFGARFDQARFGKSGDKPEQYSGVVTEPETDPHYIVTRINATSTLVGAEHFAQAVPPIGWEALTFPLRDPRLRNLTGGTNTQAAQIFLADPGVPGLIRISANVSGSWGNTIEISARKSGPVQFDVTVGYAAARFENACQVALAGRILAAGEAPLPSPAVALSKPRPIGVLQAKAGGVRADVTRDRTDSFNSQ